MKPLVVESVSRNFGGLKAVDRVSLEVQPGERRALIGPNGAGKTTLFHLISGALSPSEGRIFLFGRDATHLPAHRRAALGLARTFQIPNLFPQLTLRKNLILAALGLSTAKLNMVRPISSYSGVLSRVDRFLEHWELWDHRETLARNLSYGTQRQVEILMALFQESKLLLLDEPTGGLSPAWTAAVMDTIQKLPPSMTVLIIEHDMDVAFQLVGRITVLHMGQVLAEGSRDEIRANERVQEVYLGKGVV